MRRLTAILLATLLLGGPAHADYSVKIDNNPVVEGSGHSQTQARQLSGFDSVQCGLPVRLDITIGSDTALSLTIDDNLQDQIVTRLDHKTLVVESKGSWTSSNQPRLRITLPRLEALEVLGSAEASVRGLAGGDFAAKIVGSGDVEASGETGDLLLLIEGSGDAHLQELQAQTAKVRIDGSGDAYINVARKLEAAVNGSGDVHYRGGATVTKRVHGTGSVEAE
jgi:hypothetical protein